jgi:hypothetical protein
MEEQEWEHRTRIKAKQGSGVLAKLKSHRFLVGPASPADAMPGAVPSKPAKMRMPFNVRSYDQVASPEN